MLGNNVFFFALLAVTFDPSLAETAQDCKNNVMSRLESLLTMGDSIHANMCDLNQDHARCLYMTENRRRSSEERSEFFKLVDDALRKAGETDRLCEVDWKAIQGRESSDDDQMTKEEASKVEKCTSDFSKTVSDMVRREEGLTESEYCKVTTDVIRCVLNAVNRRPTIEEINDYREFLTRNEQDLDFSCEIDLNAAVDEYWKGRSEGGNGGGNGFIYRGSSQLFNLIWLGMLSVAARSLVLSRYFHD